MSLMAVQKLKIQKNLLYLQLLNCFFRRQKIQLRYFRCLSRRQKTPYHGTMRQRFLKRKSSERMMKRSLQRRRLPRGRQQKMHQRMDFPTEYPGDRDMSADP